MGTPYSKPQYNNENNRNSLEIDGIYVSDSTQHNSEMPWRRRHGSTEIRVTGVTRPRDRNITMGGDSLEIDGIPFVCENFDLNNSAHQTKPPRRITKSSKRSSSTQANTNKEHMIAADTSRLLALKTKVERDITETVCNSTPKIQKSQAKHCSKTTIGGHDKIDSVPGASETNTGTGACSHIKEEAKSPLTQECETCDDPKHSTNDIEVNPTNQSNNVNKKEVVKSQTKKPDDSAITSRTSTSYAEATPPLEDMKKEMVRFLTYTSFPKDDNKPYITRLAQAGFYHTRQQDEVICYVCRSRKSDWCSNMDPFKVHVDLNPNCDFLLNNSDVNIPLQTSSEIESRLTKAFYDSAADGNDASSVMPEAKRQKTEAQTNTTSRTDTQARNPMQVSNGMSPVGSIISASNQNTDNNINSTRMNEDSNRNNSTSSTNSNRNINNSTEQQVLQRSSLGSHMSEHNVQDTRAVLKHATNSGNVTTRRRTVPKYQNYVLLSARIATFRECMTIAVDSERLAACGLFFTGYGDCTRCYMCGIGLRHWSSGDDPWVEHARWSLNCAFVLEQKGQGFIDTIMQALDYRRQIDHEATADTIFTQTGTSQANNQPTQDSIISNLLHQTAAQSVLEMGYDPGMIRTAIREILHTQGREAVTAENLTEKVFAIEARMEQAKVQAKAKAQHANPATTLGNDSNKTTTTTTTPPNTKEQRKKLQCENKMLKKQSICTVCDVNEVSIVYLPCGHLITCDACAPSIKHCQMVNCGKYIRGTVRTYRS